MKRLIFILILFTPLCGIAQFVQTVGNSVLIEGSENNIALKVPMFDRSLGKLDSVLIEVRFSNKPFSNDLGLENINSSPRMVSAQKQLNYNIDIIATTAGTVTEAASGLVVGSISANLPEYDKKLDYGGTSGITKPDLRYDSVFTHKGDIKLFSGGSSDSMDILLINYVEIKTAFSGSAFKNNTSHEARVKVTYHYSDAPPLSLEEFSANSSRQYKLFPNPVSTRQTLTLEGNVPGGYYAVWNTEGRLLSRREHIANGDKVHLDISRLSQGNYLLQTPDGISIPFRVQ